MNPAAANRIRKRATYIINRIFVRSYGLWMAVVLGLREVPDSAVDYARSVRRRTTPRRIAMTAILVALIVTPTLLYVREHNRYVEQVDTYKSLTLAAASETEFLTASIRELLDQQARLTDLLLDSWYSTNARFSFRTLWSSTNCPCSTLSRMPRRTTSARAC